MPRELKAVAVKPVVKEQSTEVKVRKALPAEPEKGAGSASAFAVKTAAVKEPTRTTSGQTRVLKAEPVTEPEAKAPSVKEQPASAPKVKTPTAKTSPATSIAVKTPPVKEQSTSAATAKNQLAKTETPAPPAVKTAPAKEPPANASKAKTQVAKTETETPPAVKTAPVKEPSASASKAKTQVAKTETETPPVLKTAPVKEQSTSASTTKTQATKVEMVSAPTTKSSAPVKEHPANAAAAKDRTVKAEPVSAPAQKSAPVKEQLAAAPPAKNQVAKNETATPPAVKTAPTKEPSKNQVAKTESVTTATTKSAPVKDQPATSKSRVVKTDSAAKTPPSKDQSTIAATPKSQVAKAEPVKASTEKTVPAKETTVATTAKTRAAKSEMVKVSVVRETPASTMPARVQAVKADPPKVESPQEPTVNVQLTNGPMETAFTRLADGFDFPVGKPEAEGYYKARGFRSGGHMGEDWDGIRGGDTDLNDPIYCIGDGIVVFARDVHLGWGNVVIVRHAYRENGGVKHIDSLYGHLNSILVSRGQRVVRGQQIGKMGTAHGQYDAHLHLEIRKNLEIGMSRSKFQKNFSNYYDPSQFIASHRHLSGGGANFRVAMNTFTHDSAYHFDTAPNFSARKRSTSESSAALKRAVSSTTP